MPEDTNRPMFAEIIETKEYETVMKLSILGRNIISKTTGPLHHDRAVDWVLGWSRHLDAEWMQVREASEAVMDAFTTKLQGLGVTQDTINTAMNQVLADGK